MLTVPVQRQRPRRRIELPLPVCGLFDSVNAQRLQGETVLAAAERLIISEALAGAYTCQVVAAERLGITSRVLHYKLDLIENLLISAQEAGR